MNTTLLRLATVGLLALAATPLAAQVTVQAGNAQVTLGGYLQTQFNSSSVDATEASEFLIRRARLTTQIEINDFLSGRFQPDFAGGGARIQDAYARLTFSESFRVTLGQFKRPFDIFEIVSSSRILVIERDGDIRGVNDCSGLGGVCSFSRFTEGLELGDRDIGFMLDGTDGSGRIAYALAVTNGTGTNAVDENGSKSITGRVVVGAGPDLRIGGNVAVHDYVNGVTVDDDYALAMGADVEFGGYEGGWHGVAGVMVGDNWQNLSLAGDPSTFVAAQGILTYRAAVEGNEYVSAIEPLGRLSFGNPSTDAGNDGGVLLTPGFVLHMTGLNKLETNIDIWLPDAGDTQWSLKIQSQLHF